MEKKLHLIGIALIGGLLVNFNSTQAQEVAEAKPPMAATNKMMLEHIGIDCVICHGENGPKGVKMGNHPKQQCTDCHVQGIAKALTHKVKRTSLARDMMLKHGALINCKVCHGETGPAGMMLEHVGMDCQTCHVVEDK